MTDLFRAYVTERFKPAIFGPAAFLLTAGAVWAADSGTGAASLAATSGLALVLLLQFRLWDDLEDRDRDRRLHPERVLVQANPTPFRRACALLASANLLLLAIVGARTAAVSLVCLDLFFLIAYGPLRSRLPDRIWRFQILLFKYPAFVAVLAAALGSPVRMRLFTSAVAIYLCACAYEALHDRRAPLGVFS